jgi:hypothetical protein
LLFFVKCTSFYSAQLKKLEKDSYDFLRNEADRIGPDESVVV